MEAKTRVTVGAVHLYWVRTMGSALYRLVWQQAATPLRTLDGDGLLSEIQALSERGFADVAPGPITIEALDEQHCVCWRAYYRHPQDLRRALAMLREGASPESLRAAR